MRSEHPTLDKTPTGIGGFDEITEGGLPTGRTTLLCGGAGCGKTLFSMEYLVRGATQYGEPGVFMAFEETSDDLTKNVRSLGFDVASLVENKQLAIDYVRVDRSDIEENGEYDLEGLFVRLAFAIDSVKAKRVVLDTIEALFAGLENELILRSELRRLFAWLKERGVTTILTGEEGVETLTRQGLEEYVSDCVIVLQHNIIDQVSTRRLRIVKYRGSAHGTNPYPFLIDNNGIVVMPLTSLRLRHRVSDECISSGIRQLDAMLGLGGYYRGSSVLVSGTAGSGKTSMAAHLSFAALKRGERVLYLSLEESPDQIVRNMRSIGLDLQPFIDEGRLVLHSVRATSHGLELHLVNFYRLISDHKPEIVVVDPISSLGKGGTYNDATATVARLIDFLKTYGATAFMTDLTPGDDALEKTNLEISSMVDTWLLVRDVEADRKRSRVLFILKSRGMSHSHRLHDFQITSEGIQITPQEDDSV
ncbi:MAG: circadian clock protein KaiC [Pirellulaceae bacterium]